MSKEMRKWKNKDGSIKIYQVRTPTSYDKTLEDLTKYMEFLDIPRSMWRMVHDTFTGKVMLIFRKDDIDYLLSSEKQTNSRGKPSIKDNARVVFQMVQKRVLEMRKGAETFETAFGGVVNWLTTHKFPPKMSQELQQRGLNLTALPPPKEEMLQ